MAKIDNDRKGHSFQFYGGDILNKMGAAWFVSYSYCKRVDPAHDNWTRVGHKNRISYYERSFSYHRYWLDKIMRMQRLDVNTISLTSREIKKMAEQIMAKSW